ncbi:hypothetical protein L596_001615 [Steinernema carpocapsae]|uniref:Uncharacterized protein n=1 Tax=Steinernema carpocapsae TaxID=34508 RepID=A0A4U8ULZ4_STECR|nr:hypothetical protein L596_001615 [Steinernema carpocapsae]
MSGKTKAIMLLDAHPHTQTRGAPFLHLSEEHLRIPYEPHSVVHVSSVSVVIKRRSSRRPLGGAAVSRRHIYRRAIQSSTVGAMFSPRPMPCSRHLVAGTL